MSTTQVNRFNQNSPFGSAEILPKKAVLATQLENEESDLANYKAPESLKKPLSVFPRTLVCGGPTSAYDRALLGLRNSPMGMFDSATIQMMDDVREGLRYAFQTKNEWTLPLAGTGHVAIEALLANLLEPQDTILIPICGSWGNVFSEIARRNGATVKNIEKPWGASFSIAELEAAVMLHKPQVLYLVHGESSTGVIQKIEGMGQICRKHNCLLMVDVVATIGVVPVFVDKWGVDVSYCNNHKGLGAPVGMASVTLSPRAIVKIEGRKSKPRCYLYDVQTLIAKNYWFVDKSRRQDYQYHHSLPINLMYGLREALAVLATDGLEKIWKRHQQGTDKLCLAMEQLGLEHYVDNPSDRLVGSVTFKAIKDVKPAELVEAVRKSHGVDIGTGVGLTTGTLIRFGLLGPNTDVDIVEKVTSAFRDVLQQLQ